ncbi:8566_t:CDS:2, partial [Gigaspora margarita]
MKVNPQRPHKNTPSKNNEPTKVSSNQEKRIRRPPNSFLLYRQAIQPEITRYYRNKKKKKGIYASISGIRLSKEEYIIAMDPTIFPWYYGQFENNNPKKLPLIFPKDDSYNVINTYNDNNNAQQSLIETTTSITYPYYDNTYPY